MAAGDRLALRDGKNVKRLPSPFDDVALGGGGRYLVLHLPRERQLAVFDTAAAEVVGYLPVAEDAVRFAAGLEHLMVYLPRANSLQRYSLKTLQREAATQVAARGPVEKVLMGSASRGPVVLLGSGGAALFDPLTLNPTDGPDDPRLVSTRETPWRIAGDGSLLTVYSPDLSPQGHTLYARSAGGFKAHELDADPNFAGHLTPGPEGRYVYAARGVFTSGGKPVGRPGSYADGSRLCLPCAETEAFYLRVAVPEFPHGAEGRHGPVYLHLAGDERPVAKLGAVEAPAGLDTWGRDAFGNDRRFYLVPSAKLLVVLPASQDRLDLYRVDVDELLAGCEHDYLAVLSQPPRAATRGRPFAYRPTVRAKKGGVTLRLGSGPAGMRLTGGELTWDVPADFADGGADVILTVTDGAGQEAFHTFSLTIRNP